MSILPHQDIIAGCDFPSIGTVESSGTSGLVRPCRRDNVRSASYDLRLGTEYYLRDNVVDVGNRKGNETLQVSTLTKGTNEGLVIPANRLVIVTAHETVHLPADVVGHLSLKHDLLLRGLIMASQSQIDAGYEGRIFTLLYNLSSHPVTIKYLDSILRLEFSRLPKATDRPYDGAFTKDLTLAAALKAPVWSSLEELELIVRTSRTEVQATREKVDKETTDLREKINLTQLVAAIVAAIAATMAAIGALVGYFGPIKQLQIDLAASKSEHATIQSRVERLDVTDAVLKEYRSRIGDLESQLRDVTKNIDDLKGGTGRTNRGGGERESTGSSPTRLRR